MFYVAKFVSAWVMPPGIFIFLLLLIGFVKFRRMRKQDYEDVATQLRYKSPPRIYFFLAILLYLVSIGPVVNLVLKPLENSALAAAERTSSVPGSSGKRNYTGADYVVVLGGGAVSNVPGHPNGVLSGSSLARLMHGLSLSKELRVPLVFTGGIVYQNNSNDVLSEAEVVRRLLNQIAPEYDAYIAEPEARNTWENAQKTAEIVNTSKVVLVTSAWHMKRALWCFEKNGVEAMAAPTDFISNTDLPKFWQFLPDASVFQKLSTAMHEHVGLAWYKIRYRF